ncbi:FAD dependent oxidoreductase [Thelonectria olida]|uniref:FAD dependent oxidoreductase n=1 Tax=Thelonectria olida TaxID=1576542 RepID=A0A9P9AM45_9HYPO|nr:FAD dependent oxidoreductase [Thelonectria olida]
MLARRLLADPGLPNPNPTASYWQQPHPQNISEIRSSTLPGQRDVVILGSGITGCSVAQTLLEGHASISVTVLEARGLCSGATGRNGGHVKFNAVTEYAKHRAQLGPEAAASLVRFCLAHFPAIASQAGRHGAAEVGEVRSVTALTTFMDKSLVPDIKSSLAEFEKAFPDLQGQFRLYEGQDTKQFGLENAAAVLSGPAGAAWPFRLVNAVFRSLLTQYQERFSIETFTAAEKILETENKEYPYAIQTPRGTIHAKHIVHCTEGHVSHLLPALRGIIWPRRGQMTVQTPGDRIKAFDGKYSWAFIFRHFFDYVTQNAATGEIFIGGGDLDVDENVSEYLTSVEDDKEMTLNKIHLRGVLQEVFGTTNSLSEEQPRLKASWSGIMGFSIDGYPVVGKLPKEAVHRRGGNEWIAAGYGGYGMVNSWLCGQTVAEMVLGQNVTTGMPEPYYISPARYAALLKELDDRVNRASRSGFKALL